MACRRLINPDRDDRAGDCGRRYHRFCPCPDRGMIRRLCVPLPTVWRASLGGSTCLRPPAHCRACAGSGHVRRLHPGIDRDGFFPALSGFARSPKCRKPADNPTRFSADPRPGVARPSVARQSPLHDGFSGFRGSFETPVRDSPFRPVAPLSMYRPVSCGTAPDAAASPASGPRAVAKLPAAFSRADHQPE